MNKQGIIDKRIQRIREDAEYKLKLIDEFKKTIEEYEWKIIQKHDTLVFNKTQREFFIETLQADKEYKQQIYVAQRIIENEERARQRMIELNYEHQKVMQEQK